MNPPILPRLRVPGRTARSQPVSSPDGGRRRRRSVGAAAVMPLVAGAVVLLPSAASAATSRTWFVAPSGTVTACSANAKLKPFGTIQAALACASSGDVIQLAASKSTPYPGVGTISQNVTIKAAPGASARTVMIDASLPAGTDYDSPGLLTVAAGADVQVQGVTVECAATDCWGSPVVNHGILSLSGVTVTGAQESSAITNLSADAGQGAARLAITDSTIAHNNDRGNWNGDGGAGAIGDLNSPDGVQSQLTVTDSTIADNTATTGADAGAIATNAVQDGAVQLSGDTITANTGELSGGLQDSIGQGGSARPIELANTIVAGNTTTVPSSPYTSPDCSGVLGDLPGGHNLLGSNSLCNGLTNGADGDQVGTAQTPIGAQLAPLAFNGGSTETAPPLTGSPAIGNGDPNTCEFAPLFDVDQRGDSRKASTRQACDVGAYDTGGTSAVETAPTIKLAASAIGTQGKHLTVQVSATGSPTAALTESGALPLGVTFVDDGNGTGQLAGKPASGTAGTYSVTITAGNGIGSDAAKTLELRIN